MFARTREWQNKHGVCPEQLKARLKQFILENKCLPNSHNEGRMIYKHLRKNFGSISQAFKSYGLPSIDRFGTTYICKFDNEEIWKFNINQQFDRQLLFNRIIEKCSLFSPEDRLKYL